MKAYELMSILAKLPCNTDVLLCNMTSNPNLKLNGCYDIGDEYISLEVETEEVEEEEEEED